MSDRLLLATAGGDGTFGPDRFLVGPTRFGAAYVSRALAGSALLHALLLLLLVAGTLVRPLEPPPPSSIEVELVPGAPSPRLPAPATVAPPPAIAAPPDRPAGPSRILPPAAPTQPAPQGDGMTHPSHLLAQAYIGEAASAEIRRALPKLAPSERATQICNIEAGQQIGAALRLLVDTVHASALSDTDVEGLTVTAPGAAYRSRRQWFGVSFVCTVRPDFSGVADFAFKLGAPVPRQQWDAHGLNAADADE
ncbi:MAG: DUF930 domain-containing protein [Reyranella sp.]